MSRLILLLMFVLSGCLSSSYTVSRRELLRVASTRPQVRGGSVRVTQELGTSDEPQPARASAPLIIGAGVSVGGPVYSPAYSRTRVYTRPTSRSPRTGNQRQSSSNSDGDAVIAALVVGAVVGVTLAATEGMRFDGYVQMLPTQPVHLIRGGQELGWVALGDLQPDLALQADSAVVSDLEGPLYRLRRAPLYRVGAAFDFEIGAGGLNSIPADDWPLGLAARIAMGGFFHPSFGMFLGLGLANGTLPDRESHAQFRPFLEFQAFLPPLTIVHVGGYIEGGYSFGSQFVATGVESSLDTWFTGAGLLVQLELTTRFALTLRGGADLFWGPEDNRLIVPQVLAGFTVY